MTVLEAQVNGLVSVVLGERGMKNLVKNGYNGFLIEDGDKRGFADKIIKLLSNKALYMRMKKNTLKEIKKHELPNVIKIWENEYAKLIKSRQQK
jgi:glycosyltransferase involved in cell wall biosynthesis